MAVGGQGRCLPDLPAGRQQYEDASGRRFAALTISCRIATAITGGYGIAQLFLGRELWHLSAVNLVTAILFMAVPMLYRFGAMVAAWAFVVVAYASTAYLCSQLGTGSGLQFYFVVAAAIHHHFVRRRYLRNRQSRSLGASEDLFLKKRIIYQVDPGPIAAD